MSAENNFQEKCKNIIICLCISDTAFLNSYTSKLFCDYANMIDLLEH